MIKQNQFEVGQIQFSFFLLTVCTIFRATFCRKPHWNWSIGSKDMSSWRMSKTIGNKGHFCFVWLYLKINISDFRLILIDHITYSQIDFYFKALSTEHWRVQQQALPLCIWDELLWSWSRKYWRLSWLFVPKYIFNIPNWLMVIGLWLVNLSFCKSWNYLLQD